MMTDAERILRLEACVDNLTKANISLQEQINKAHDKIKVLEYRTWKFGKKKKGGK